MVQPSRFKGGDQNRGDCSQLSRRSWLAGALLGLTGAATAPRIARSMQAREAAIEADEIASVQASAKKAGLGPFAQSRTDHFLGMGDADDRFRNTALGICESEAAAFQTHFREKGFKVAMPAGRLTVITLKNDASYRAYSGEDPGPTVGGHYDLDTNRLVMFDFRPKRDELGNEADPERINLLALVHETTHLLCYNSGLLSRQTDVPDWVSEGLATYVELWRKKPPTRIGATNRPWLLYLRQVRETGTPWIPIAELIAADDTFWNTQTQQLSYAESWLMVHYLMKEPQLARFRSYLAGLPARGRGTAAQRVEHAERHFGSLRTLDRELVRHFKGLPR